MLATIKDIAERTGFSLSTVSIVLRGDAEKRHISPSTQKKILDCAREVGYMPNVSARRLRSETEPSNSIAVFWANDFRAEMSAEFMHGVYRYIAETGFDCEIVICSYTPGTLHKTATSRKLALYTGVIICNATAADIAYIDSIEILCPAVVYNRLSERYPCVQVDNYEIGRIAARKLISDGCGDLVIVSDSHELSYASSRISGFAEECARSFVSYQTVFTKDNTIATGRECADKLLLSRNKSGIFICSSDYTAFGILDKLASKSIDTPDQAELITVGTRDEDFYSCIHPKPSYIRIPLKTMAYECTKLIAKALNDGSNERTIVTVPHELIIGDTTLPD